jgi:diguanylate cyclase (GGDEF)-like protein
MALLQLLSEIIIETLKKFSMEKRPLTVDSLQGALSTQEELLSLLEQPPLLPAPSSKTPARVSLKCALPTSNELFFKQMQFMFVKFLEMVEPIAKEENHKRLATLKNSVCECRSAEALASLGNELVDAVDPIVCRAIEQIGHSNDFLSELSENLGTIEKELFSYQTHNRETYLLHDRFCDNLLSHTEDLNDAVCSLNPVNGTRQFIASRLNTIGKALELKKKEDEDRLKEADSKIAELQNSVRTYNDEIIQVTERANALEKEMLLDPLTKIHNRRAYDLKIRECLRSYHRSSQHFSLVLIDVDHFKKVNDRYGHHAGDKCLMEISKLVAASLRKTDFLARYGGEELVAILPGSTGEDAAAVAEKLRSRISKARFYYHEEVIQITISLGVTSVQPGDTDPELIFVRVDEAMYMAKNEGRNMVCTM